MDIMLAGEDQSQADQPNSLAEGPPAPLCMLQQSCPRRQQLTLRNSAGFFPLSVHIYTSLAQLPAHYRKDANKSS
eukprot:1142091-Pelagomonas_calceolata.AAC.1